VVAHDIVGTLVELAVRLGDGVPAPGEGTFEAPLAKFMPEALVSLDPVSGKAQVKVSWPDVNAAFYVVYIGEAHASDAWQLPSNVRDKGVPKSTVGEITVDSWAPPTSVSTSTRTDKLS